MGMVQRISGRKGGSIMIKVHQIKIKITDNWENGKNRTDQEAQRREKELLWTEAARLLQIPETDICKMQIIRRSIDARKKPELYNIYSLRVQVRQEEQLLKWARRKKKTSQIMPDDTVDYCFPEPGTARLEYPPVIVGMGPAGLFCGYYLALHGYRPLILERGRDVDSRAQDVERFWQEGILRPDSNVQFGEGGAGTFSDGKLNTLVKDRDGRNQAVLRTLSSFGAKESICYDAKPHIGTDVLTQVVKRMREEIIRLGGTVRFESTLTDIVLQRGAVREITVNGSERIPCRQLVLALGHSARDTFSMLYERGIPMEAKSFAVGLRVEHPQSMINASQYGGENCGYPGAATYKVTAKTSVGRGVYSFCMCPGGYVVNASSEPGRLAVNGMSYSGREGCNANSAIIVSVTPGDYGSDHPLAGIEFQRTLEERAYRLAEGRIPVQRYGVFREKVRGGACALPDRDTQTQEEALAPQMKGAYAWADVSTILPGECNEAIVEGMESFGRQIRGFDRTDAILSGVESRTSSPVRILRDETLQSACRGIYPCGEGAGYAGGITSAAMDGIRAAEAIAGSYAPADKWENALTN